VRKWFNLHLWKCGTISVTMAERNRSLATTGKFQWSGSFFRERVLHNEHEPSLYIY